MVPNDNSTSVEAIRRFNRFYTRQIGVLTDKLLHSPFGLTEARVLYELAQQEPVTATTLNVPLGLDTGYLSRILRAFERDGLITRQPSETDARQSILTLTDRGRDAFADLNARSEADIAEVLDSLSPEERNRLLAAMATIENILNPSPDSPAYLLRPHQPGDMGWVVHRHGVLYVQEYGWDERFEALCARIVADFIQNFDFRRERCWIAERDGARVGSVFVVRESEEVAKLRLLLVEPSARGLGIGRRLVEDCVRFARQAGYKKMVLWTQSILEPARRIYSRAGFRLVRSEQHENFGKNLTGEVWEREL